ncbi:MAG: hypothetical protein V8S96_06100 [Lachnospiraceae bacterium]
MTKKKQGIEETEGETEKEECAMKGFGSYHPAIFFLGYGLALVFSMVSAFIPVLVAACSDRFSFLFSRPCSSAW